MIVDNLHEIFIEYIALRDNSWQLEELRSSAKFARSSHKYAHADLAYNHPEYNYITDSREHACRNDS
jgi:hypothetical protein